jgi:hypothetical protein
MLLFPYAKDVEYINGELSFVLQLLNKEQETQISVKMQTSPELSLMVMFDMLCLPRYYQTCVLKSNFKHFSNIIRSYYGI